jgi:hypothetical protein
MMGIDLSSKVMSDLLFQMSVTILAYQNEEFLVSVFPSVKYS